MKRRKFITQLTLTALGLPFISTIRNQQFQSHSLNCISLGNMAIETKELFIKKGLIFDKTLSVETFSTTNLPLLVEQTNKTNSKLLIIADPSSLNESKLLFSLLLSLTNNRKEYHAYIYLPFNFVGEKLQNEMKKMRMRLGNHENIVFIYLLEECRLYGNIPMREALENIYTKVFYDFIKK